MARIAFEPRGDSARLRLGDLGDSATRRLPSSWAKRGPTTC